MAGPDLGLGMCLRNRRSMAARPRSMSPSCMKSMRRTESSFRLVTVTRRHSSGLRDFLKSSIVSRTSVSERGSGGGVCEFGELLFTQFGVGFGKFPLCLQRVVGPLVGHVLHHRGLHLLLTGQLGHIHHVADLGLTALVGIHL